MTGFIIHGHLEALEGQGEIRCPYCGKAFGNAMDTVDATYRQLMDCTRCGIGFQVQEEYAPGATTSERQDIREEMDKKLDDGDDS